MCSMFVTATLSDTIKCADEFAEYIKKINPDYEVCRKKVEARLHNIKENLVLKGDDN